ncbi:MAG TPA: adenylate kinase [Diaminobutyricibacter sp.]
MTGVVNDSSPKGARLLIVGPPGSGKGTQAARISSAYGIPDVSTGDIFRANIKNGTPLGVQVKEIVDAGDYVPDSLTNALVTERLEEDDARNGFLLDGYPRTLEQVHYLDGLLGKKGQSLDGVIQLVADRDEVVSRLTKRAQEQGRVDDSEEAIRHRQEVYLRETSPLIDVYRDRGLLIEVDGLGGVDEVASRLTRALADRGILPTAERDSEPVA